MKKFTKILENSNNKKLSTDPIRSLNTIIEYIMNMDNILDDFIEDAYRYRHNTTYIEFENEMKNSLDSFEKFTNIIKKYNLEEITKEHIVYDAMVIKHHILNNVKPTTEYIKKINK